MPKLGRSWGFLCAVGIGAALAAAPHAAWAASINVDCDAGQTISDALASLDMTGPNSITVAGTCHEAVAILNRDRLSLFGFGATIMGTDGVPVVNVGGSKNISITGFTLTGGSMGLRVARASEVVASHLTPQANTGAGITVVDNSFLRLDGAMTIQNNGGSGIAGTSARISLSDGEGSNSIANNLGVGVSLADGSKGNFLGATTIQGNGGAGVLVFHTSSINLFGAVVDSNGDTGVNVQETSHGELGTNTISNNGASTSGGGIRVADNSDLYIDGGVTVTGNTGIGVQAELAGQLSSVGGNTITGSGHEGVRVRRMGLAHFFAPDAITGQGGIAVTCDNTSLIVGDLTGVSKVKCSNVDKEVGSPAPAAAGHLHAASGAEGATRAASPKRKVAR